jgi:transmembrane protein
MRSAQTIVNDRRTVWLARGLLASPFVFSGLTKALDFPGAVAEVRALTGLEPATAIAVLVIAIQLGGSGLLLLGRTHTVLGDVLLAAFTLVATLYGHPFWTRDGIQVLRDATTFLEHLGLMAGFGLLVRDALLQADTGS